MAPKADFRLFQIATYSGSLRVRQVIDRATEPLCVRTISAIACASPSRPASRPSTSMIRMAPASVGKPKWNACSTAWIISVSSISSAAGTMPAAMIADTASEASSIAVNEARIVFTASAAWSRRTVTAVTMPNVPSEPTAAPRRS